MSSFWTGEDLGSVPNAECAKNLKANFVGQCQKAADALQDADILLLVTGAGFSADSGLAVYNDVANIPAYQSRNLDYMGICTPDWLKSDPALFYGFWGQCFNDYRSTKPHEGYDILARWGKDLNMSTGSQGGTPTGVAQEIRERVARKVALRRPFDEDIVVQNSAYEVQSESAGAFFSFTSNVDAHMFDTFEAKEIHECHGNIETWQCSSPYCTSGIWRAPLDYAFAVDTQTMLAVPTQDALKQIPTSMSTQENVQQSKSDNVPHIGQTKGIGVRQNPLRHMPPTKDTKGWLNGSWPRCGHCRNPARPAVLMFGDFDWKSDLAQAKRWSLWKESVLDLCENRGRANPLNICIVEVGCGLTVPSGRGASEGMVLDVLGRGGDISLVRINPDFPLSNDSAILGNLVPIMSRGLKAITQIDQLYRSTKQ